MNIINAFFEFLKTLLGLNDAYNAPVVDRITMVYLKSFRTKENTEIVVAKYENLSAAAGPKQAKKIMKSLRNVNYVMVEYDPKSDNILRFEGAKDAEDKIKSAIQQSKNGVLVIS